jgi:hypothetical protein
VDHIAKESWVRLATWLGSRKSAQRCNPPNGHPLGDEDVAIDKSDRIVGVNELAGDQFFARRSPKRRKGVRMHCPNRRDQEHNPDIFSFCSGVRNKKPRRMLAASGR